MGTAGVPNYFRVPSGPGWALVGDAGYCKDPITAQGISDAFIDAENVADAIDAGFSGRRPLEEAMADAGNSPWVFPCGDSHLAAQAVARTIVRANQPSAHRALGRFGIAPWSAAPPFATELMVRPRRGSRNIG